MINLRWTWFPSRGGRARQGASEWGRLGCGLRLRQRHIRPLRACQTPLCRHNTDTEDTEYGYRVLLLLRIRKQVSQRPQKQGSARKRAGPNLGGITSLMQCKQSNHGSWLVFCCCLQDVCMGTDAATRRRLWVAPGRMELGVDLCHQPPAPLPETARGPRWPFIESCARIGLPPRVQTPAGSTVGTERGWADGVAVLHAFPPVPCEPVPCEPVCRAAVRAKQGAWADSPTTESGATALPPTTRRKGEKGNRVGLLSTAPTRADGGATHFEASQSLSFDFLPSPLFFF